MEDLKIGQIGDIVTGKTPKTKIKDNFGHDYLFITPSDMINGFPIKETGRYLSSKGLVEVNNNSISGISILVDCIGSDLGNVALTDRKCVTNQQINSITNLKEDINPYYVYFWFKNKKNFLQRIAGGTSVPIINKTQFSNIKIRIPNKDTQNKISNSLLMFENKIEINNNLINYFEEYSQLLFHKWFVDFNFPDSNNKQYKSNGGDMWKIEEDSIPSSWTIKNMGEIADFKNGLNYSGNSNKKPNAKIISVTQLSDYLILNDGIASDFYLDRDVSDEYLIKKYNTIIARSASPGECSIALDDLDSYYSGFSIRIRPLDEIYKYFIFFNTLRLKKLITSNSDGTIIKNITQQNLKRFKIITPDEEIIKKFNDLIEPLLLKIQSLNKENKLLGETRDLLIKKLIK